MATVFAKAQMKMSMSCWRSALVLRSVWLTGLLLGPWLLCHLWHLRAAGPLDLPGLDGTSDANWHLCLGQQCVSWDLLLVTWVAPPARPPT